MLSYEVIRNDTYSNKSCQMEREMCSYLEWQLNVEPTTLIEFQEMVKRDFKGPGPYPTYAAPLPAPSSIPSTTLYIGTACTPLFISGRAPSTSPPKPTPRLPR
ncbi:uncharacterized protein PHACADRAFT_190915 [Phanerochaete carnosa HHB-10118-sp]|uniref:Cyclin N-terminal domain-containing protein n=1 Tax=Phanerochaete carnosa (strain HHB-10118-sp) TaxID=650164 RepID=K5WQH1_PHACS|nr:uncharacterized protein PHACADRAFT_190915 [Phanerochaete carnosa HHB-10118-sp]EKM61730.1 hypothetical protein PHACADRAFT_190915 [Phanerochaete carnosa HHB-10118-sp]